MKTLNQLYLDRLIKFDKAYFKDYDVPKNDREIEKWLARYLDNQNFAIDKDGWTKIMEIRKIFPEFWWQCLENLFHGTHRKP